MWQQAEPSRRKLVVVDGVADMKAALLGVDFLAESPPVDGDLNHRLYPSARAWARAVVEANPTMTRTEFRATCERQGTSFHDTAYYHARRQLRGPGSAAPVPEIHNSQETTSMNPATASPPDARPSLSSDRASVDTSDPIETFQETARDHAESLALLLNEWNVDAITIRCTGDVQLSNKPERLGSELRWSVESP